MESQISLEQIKNFRKIYNSDKTNKIIENTGHTYKTKESETGDIIFNWIKKLKENK